ncbi:unnamed protein product [Eruca vesicaria subsp. sativa]|uniref:Uncharacterized protein n=1 Tax=Eruca vesicaria subsp. sativa TaxID=29727 RepID=A0ABC8LS83_ERUVS|nr:unnamed protein product [Eruca vesicaria subsp. sativa]
MACLSDAQDERCNKIDSLSLSAFYLIASRSSRFFSDPGDWKDAPIFFFLRSLDSSIEQDRCASNRKEALFSDAEIFEPSLLRAFLRPWRRLLFTSQICTLFRSFTFRLEPHKRRLRCLALLFFLSVSMVLWDRQSLSRDYQLEFSKLNEEVMRLQLLLEDVKSVVSEDASVNSTLKDVQEDPVDSQSMQRVKEK